jgi:hypothetical protein
MIRKCVAMFFVAIAAGCSNTALKASSPTQSESGPAKELTPDAPQTPLRVRWKVLSDSGGRLVADAVVERRAQLRFPVEVRLSLPEQLTLVSGTAPFVVPADGQTGELVRRFEFAYTGSPPPGDLMLIADARDTGLGIHATDSYRFGRHSETKKPQTTGPGIFYGDKDLGPAIPLEPAK